MNSTSMIYQRGAYSPERYQSFLGLASHEYFHLWNVKRIRPESLGPFNYEAENYTHGLWIAEGFTSYYDDLLLRRAGIISEDAYLQIASGNINGVVNRSGDEVQNWLKLSDDERDTVMAALPERLTALGMPAEGDRQQAEDLARAQRGVARRKNKRRNRRA